MPGRGGRCRAARGSPRPPPTCVRSAPLRTRVLSAGRRAPPPPSPPPETSRRGLMLSRSAKRLSPRRPAVAVAGPGQGRGTRHPTAPSPPTRRLEWGLRFRGAPQRPSAEHPSHVPTAAPAPSAAALPRGRDSPGAAGRAQSARERRQAAARMALPAAPFATVCRPGFRRRAPPAPRLHGGAAGPRLPRGRGCRAPPRRRRAEPPAREGDGESRGGSPQSPLGREKCWEM